MKNSTVNNLLSIDEDINYQILVGPQIAKLTNRLRRYIDNEMKAYDLSRTQWQVMCILRNTGPCSQQDLLGNLDIDAAHLTRVLDKLENKNYIIRERLSQDRRSLFIKMTPLATEQLLPHLIQVNKQEHEILLEGLTNCETQQLIKLLKKLENNINKALSKTMKDDINE